MAQRIETITQHIFAFDEGEIARILNALGAHGDAELYADILDALHDEDVMCDCEDKE